MLPLGNQKNIIMSMLLEPVSRSKTTLDRLQGIPHLFVHGSWWPKAADTKDQRPAGGVNHTKSDSTINDVLQPDAATDSITWTLAFNETLFTHKGPRHLVNLFASNSTAFETSFVSAITKFRRIGVKTGNQGEFSCDCTMANWASH